MSAIITADVSGSFAVENGELLEFAVKAGPAPDDLDPRVLAFLLGAGAATVADPEPEPARRTRTRTTDTDETATADTKEN